MIDTLVSHTFEESCYEDPLEKCLAYFGHNFDIDESLKEVNTLLDSVPIMYTDQWKSKVEPLPVSTSIPIPSIIEPLKLELKLLPDTLKYAFLGDSKIFCDDAPYPSWRICQNLEKTTETFKPCFERGGESGGHKIIRRGYHLPFLR